jgi:hypothetical protein
MKFGTLIVATALVGCAGLPTNVRNSAIQPTVIELAGSVEDVRSRIIRAAALAGWTQETNDLDAGLLVYYDPTQKAGWLTSYRVRYNFFLSPIEDEMTEVHIKAVGVERFDTGESVNEGPTSALKWWEEKAAERIGASTEGAP